MFQIYIKYNFVVFALNNRIFKIDLDHLHICVYLKVVHIAIG